MSTERFVVDTANNLVELFIMPTIKYVGEFVIPELSILVLTTTVIYIGGLLILSYSDLANSFLYGNRQINIFDSALWPIILWRQPLIWFLITISTICYFIYIVLDRYAHPDSADLETVFTGLNCGDDHR